MYSDDNPQRDKHNDAEILFSKSVKAGKRVYYIDVKRDRRGELYISMTESKRIKGQGDADHPVFEKHKIFLYREDLEKFMQAFQEVTSFTQANSPYAKSESDGNEADIVSDNKPQTDEDYKINIDF